MKQKSNWWETFHNFLFSKVISRKKFNWAYSFMGVTMSYRVWLKVYRCYFMHMKRFLFFKSFPRKTQRVLMINTSYKIVFKDSLISIFQHLVNAKWKWVCLKTLSFERLVYSKSAFEDIDKKGYDIHVLFFSLCINY